MFLEELIALPRQRYFKNIAHPVLFLNNNKTFLFHREIHVYTTVCIFVYHRSFPPTTSVNDIPIQEVLQHLKSAAADNFDGFYELVQEHCWHTWILIAEEICFLFSYPLPWKICLLLLQSACSHIMCGASLTQQF